jgi:hypothetical protein
MLKSIFIEIKWALLFVVMTLLWMVMERYAGLHDRNIHQHAIYTNFIAIPAILLYIFALLDKRNNFYNGTMNYKQGFISGAIITLIVTLFSPLTQWITSTFITPHFFENVTKYVVEQKLMTEVAAKNYFNLKSFLIQATIGSAVMGTATSAIVAIFTRGKKEA